MKKILLQSHSEEQTQKIAACLVKHLSPPVTLVLEGDLGAGKTCFVNGLVQGLDLKLRARSPTYALAHTYQTLPVIHHVDLYRVLDQDLEDLGIENLLDDQEAVICVEWAKHSKNPLPDRLIQIGLTASEQSEQAREIQIEFSDAFNSDWVLTVCGDLLSLSSNAG